MAPVASNSRERASQGVKMQEPPPQRRGLSHARHRLPQRAALGYAGARYGAPRRRYSNSGWSSTLNELEIEPASRRQGRVALTALALLMAATAAAAAPLFEDVSADCGLPQVGPTCGVVALDLDGDGTFELLLNLHSNDLPAVARQIAPLRFETEPFPATGLNAPDHHGTTVADLDGHGAPEFYLTVGADQGFGWSNKRLLVPEAGVWVDRAAELGVTDPYGRGRSALFLDLTGGPDCDLIVLNYRSAPRVFADFSLDAPATDAIGAVWPGIKPAPADPPVGAAAPPETERERADYIHRLVPGYLLDPDAPVYFAFGERVSVYRKSESGALVDVGQWPASAALARKPADALIADLDGDLLNDLYLVRGDGPPRTHPAYQNDVFLQHGPGALVPAERADGALLDGTGHRVRAGDFDNDGQLDLLILRRKDLSHDREPALLRGLGAGRFEDVTAEWGLDGFRGGVSQDALLCDLDRDGDLDLVLAQGDHDMRGAIGGFRVYRNDADARGGASIQLLLEGPDGRDAQAYGARLIIHAGDRAWARDHWPTQVDNSAMTLPVHVGIGAAASVDSVVIRWPDGTQQVARDLPANTQWKWREGEPPRHLE